MLMQSHDSYVAKKAAAVTPKAKTVIRYSNKYVAQCKLKYFIKGENEICAVVTT